MDKLIIGCGYLGRRVAARWLAQGHQVFGTARTVERADELRQLGVEPVVVDVLDPESLRKLPQADGVLHCVGFDRTAGQGMREIYVDGLANVLEALRSTARFLYISSTGVYGFVAGEDVDEESVTVPLEESGRIVLAAEQWLRAESSDAIVLRFAGIYGAGRLLRRTRELAAEVALSVDPERWLNLIHVEDGAEAVVAADSRGRPGRIYNVCDDRPVRRGEFYGLLASLLGTPPPRFAPPTRPEAGPLAHRRITNRRLHGELEVSLRYPSYVEGLPAAIGSAPRNSSA